MKNFFSYCIYRIAKFYKKTQLAHDYVAQGYFLLFFSLTAYTLTILRVILFFFNIKIDKTIIIIACIPLVFEIIFFNKIFPNAQAKYNKYEKENKNEKNKWFKGLLVFLFLSLSLISYVVVSFVFKV